MRTLAYLLGSRSLDLALGRSETAVRREPEPDLPPLATTAESAAAWRRWAQAGWAADAVDPASPLPAVPSPRVRPSDRGYQPG
jgi:hypothetical protein